MRLAPFHNQASSSSYCTRGFWLQRAEACGMEICDLGELRDHFVWTIEWLPIVYNSYVPRCRTVFIFAPYSEVLYYFHCNKLIIKDKVFWERQRLLLPSAATWCWYRVFCFCLRCCLVLWRSTANQPTKSIFDSCKQNYPRLIAWSHEVIPYGRVVISAVHMQHFVDVMHAVVRVILYTQI